MVTVRVMGTQVQVFGMPLKEQVHSTLHQKGS